MSKIIVTGAAGFIGYHLSGRLLRSGHAVWGIDNLNRHYDLGLKQARLKNLLQEQGFEFCRLDLRHRHQVQHFFSQHHDAHYVFHLAAQTGVRASLTQPNSYASSNVVGFLNLLEACRNLSLGRLFYASSSSVYGQNRKTPFSETDTVSTPASLYAATKTSNELMAYAYASLYNMPLTGLRFFTVYGPYGRPDMAAFKFVKAMSENKPLHVYNHGNMSRDFTYIDDVTEALSRLLAHKEKKSFTLYNIGRGQPTTLKDFIRTIERCMGKVSKKRYLPLQKGDVHSTFADTSALKKAIGYVPSVSLEVGMRRFTRWYASFYP